MLGDTWPRKDKTKCLGIYVLRRSAGIVSALQPLVHRHALTSQLIC